VTFVLVTIASVAVPAFLHCLRNNVCWYVLLEVGNKEASDGASVWWYDCVLASTVPYCLHGRYVAKCSVVTFK
jgi:hypothetical protein